MTLRRIIASAGLTAALLYTLWTCAAQVDPGERGVVYRFGRGVANVGPGLYLGMPWGIDRVERVAVARVRRVTVGFIPSGSDDLGQSTPPGQLLTGDHNLVNVQVVLEYAVIDKEVELFALYGDRADGLVARTAETVLAEWIAGRGVDEVIGRGKTLLPAVLLAETQSRLAPYNLGVRIQLANVIFVLPPRQVKDEFDAVGRAQTEIQTRITEAQQDAETNWSAALNFKSDLERRTTTYVNTRSFAARSDAAAFQDRLDLFRIAVNSNPNYASAAWAEQMTRLLTSMQETNRVRVLDHRLAADLDLLDAPFGTKEK